MSTNSRLVKLNFKPGINRESTEYAEEGSWYNGDKVRSYLSDGTFQFDEKEVLHDTWDYFGSQLADVDGDGIDELVGGTGDDRIYSETLLITYDRYFW